MEPIKDLIENTTKIVREITNTARYVNSDSHKRKNITLESLAIIEKLMSESSILRSHFKEILQKLDDSQKIINTNSKEFKANVESYSGIILYLNNIKKTLNTLENEINKLTGIIEIIKNDTDEIFILALNASIESSKYSHTAKVFDVLADKLNGMSSFINQNLENIVKVVDPIIQGIHRLIEENSIILKDIEEGHKNFLEFTDILNKQKKAIKELVSRANMSVVKFEDQKKMLDDINEMVNQMSNDASGAITGSGNVIEVGEELGDKVQQVLLEYTSGNNYLEKIDYIQEQSTSVWHTAQDVNEKSKSQLDFSLNCVSFCESMITESEELQKTISIFKEQSVDNNNMANFMSQNMSQLSSQFIKIKEKISNSNETIDKFNEDYKQINNILNFLKSILKSMKVIGMYSRIESSRDPDEFMGFMTIYKNIIKLQSGIQNNIPQIEDNINNSHGLIEDINTYFNNISSVFFTIVENSNSIIEKFKEIINISAESESISQSIVDESKEIDMLLKELRNFLNELSEVVKKPIEGSAANIERGKNVENICREIKELVSQSQDNVIKNSVSSVTA